MLRRTSALVAFQLALCAALPAAGQGLDVPFATSGGDGQAAWCASSVVRGLDPQGDGFLAVRSGPGTNYRMLGKLYEGDVVLICDGSGNWRGIVQSESGLKGWSHRNWLADLAG